MAQVSQSKPRKSYFKGSSALRKAQQRGTERAASRHQLYHGSSSDHSAPVPVIMRREGVKGSTNQGSVVCYSQAHNRQ